MPQTASMLVAVLVACSRSPLTPDELSPSKNIRSPAREARDTRMSDSSSPFQWLNWSSGFTLETMPR